MIISTFTILNPPLALWQHRAWSRDNGQQPDEVGLMKMDKGTASEDTSASVRPTCCSMWWKILTVSPI